MSKTGVGWHFFVWQGGFVSIWLQQLAETGYEYVCNDEHYQSPVGNLYQLADCRAISHECLNIMFQGLWLVGLLHDRATCVSPCLLEADRVIINTRVSAISSACHPNCQPSIMQLANYGFQFCGLVSGKLDKGHEFVIVECCVILSPFHKQISPG